MIEFKYRVGKKWEYEYLYDITPYTPEEKNIIWLEETEKHGKIWGLDFQDPQNEDLKLRTSKTWG